ncbi:hypothetical protein A0J61_07137 [Choanephora cucurbitarum]|uniref:Uncharacterized protein n=1 Tax=Choanephora cucurbitarum TaxID=101091 RepID=A0A1C7N6P7_9FUNG|nr:hypothetical protein A0J61_07137 [Choanephora cucurbitarum]
MSVTHIIFLVIRTYIHSKKPTTKIYPSDFLIQNRSQVNTSSEKLKSFRVLWIADFKFLSKEEDIQADVKTNFVWEDEEEASITASKRIGYSHGQNVGYDEGEWKVEEEECYAYITNYRRRAVGNALQGKKTL